MQFIPSRWNVAFVPISIRFQTNHPSIFYEAMAHQLARIGGVKVSGSLGDSSEFYRDRCLELVHAIDEMGVPTVVIVDGLDEATEKLRKQLISAIARFTAAHPRVPVVVTSRPAGAPGGVVWVVRSMMARTFRADRAVR
jgi:hypothetical protein